MCLNPQVVGMQPTSVTPNDAAVGACAYMCACVRWPLYQHVSVMQSSCSVACSCGGSLNSQLDVTVT